MFKTKKMVTVVAMVAMLALTGKESASAKIQLSPVDEVIEMVGSSNVSTVSASLSISEEGKATTSVRVVGKAGKTTKISATVKLQKYNKSTGKWSAVKTWTKSSETLSLSMAKTHALSKKGTYRTKLIATVFNGNSSENVTACSSKATY